MLSIFKPAPHKARLPAAEIDPTYRRLRWQIFLGDILWLCGLLFGS
ncbi:Truncated glycerol-3-phosphate transporter [Escherichia coli]